MNSKNMNGLRRFGIQLSVAITALIAAFYSNAAPIYYSGTGNYYEVVSADAITWKDAQTAANSSSFWGVNGYLATLTSSGENDFVNMLRQLITTSTAFQDTEFWIGAYQVAGSNSPSDGWTWVNGEGLLSDGYTNWAANEPNNSGGNEAYAAIGFLGTHNWNDEGNLAGIGGYVIEYDVPAPGIAALFIVGLIGIRVMRNKK